MTGRLVVANWKMNGSKAFVQKYSNIINRYSGINRLIIAPPFPYLTQLQGFLNNKSINIAAQDFYLPKNTGCTSGVSIEMLKDCQCDAVIIGHQEVMQKNNLTIEYITHQIKLAVLQQLTPIICLSGPCADLVNQLQQIFNYHQDNLAKIAIRHKSDEEIDSNLSISLLEIIQTHESARKGNNILSSLPAIIIAYEPAESIGGEVSSPLQEIKQAISVIKEFFELNLPNILLKVLYGGSVNLDNAKQIVDKCNTDGVMLGRIGLDATLTLQIAQSIE